MSWICSCIQQIPGHGHKKWFLASTHSFSSTFTFIPSKERCVQTKCAEVGIKSLSFQLVLLLSPLFAVPSSSHSTKKNPKLLQFFLSFCWFLFTLLQWEFSRVRSVFLPGAYKTWHPPPPSKPWVNLLHSFLTFFYQCEEQVPWAAGHRCPHKIPCQGDAS